MTDFSTLGLNEAILRAILEEGYSKPTPIQAQAIPPILAGRDLLGCAQTGTGKTAAFALPILHELLTKPVEHHRRGPKPPRALIICPTRELAAQIGDSFTAYGRHTGLSHTVIYGGVNQRGQTVMIRKGLDVLIATPGRLMDLQGQRAVNLSDVGILVLDEADRMLDMGFIVDIRKIAASVPSPRQTLMFSATMPKEILHLAESLLRDPVRVSVATVSSTPVLIEQRVFMVPKREKQSLLERLLKNQGITRALVFTRTKLGADRVHRGLLKARIPSVVIHGDREQHERERALDSFRSGRSKVLVATDVAARGLDIDLVSHVFNFDLSHEPEAHVHRIGRTGRAGAAGIAFSFCDPEERRLLRDIEKLIGKKIPVAGEDDVMPVAIPAARAAAPPVDPVETHKPLSEDEPAIFSRPTPVVPPPVPAVSETEATLLPEPRPAGRSLRAWHAPSKRGRR